MALNKATFNEFQMNKCDENRDTFTESNRARIKAVRIDKAAAYEYI